MTLLLHCLYSVYNDFTPQCVRFGRLKCAERALRTYRVATKKNPPPFSDPPIPVEIRRATMAMRYGVAATATAAEWSITAWCAIPHNMFKPPTLKTAHFLGDAVVLTARHIYPVLWHFCCLYMRLENVYMRLSSFVWKDSGWCYKWLRWMFIRFSCVCF